MADPTMALARPRPNGGSVAAFLSACAGLLVLGIVVLATELSEAAGAFVFGLGKTWVPGAQRIGPYSGKETFLLIGWLGSWLALHLALRHRDVNVKLAFAVAMLMLAVAIALVWPPVWHLFG